MKKTKVLLLACAFLLTAAAATRPAKSEDCIIRFLCVSCPTPTPPAGVKLCRQVICPDSISETCGACGNVCILPPD